MELQQNGKLLVPVNPGEYELQTIAAAQREKSLIEAAYMVAINRPRNEAQARAELLAACKRPIFAGIARYKKPISGSLIIGPSIRFAEEAVRAFGNIHISKVTVFEDNEKRKIAIRVTDLEKNNSYDGEIVINKTVERKQLKKGQQAISQRVNSYGETVYLLEATEDELANKTEAQASKIIRNCVLRLIPSDVVEDAMAIISNTLEQQDATDPKAAMKKIYDSFTEIGILPAEIAKYLGHSRPQLNPQELGELRMIYTAIKNGETNWQSILEAKFGEKTDSEATKVSNLEDMAAKAKKKSNKDKLSPSSFREVENSKKVELTEAQRQIMIGMQYISTEQKNQLLNGRMIEQLSDEECFELDKVIQRIVDEMA